MEIKQISIDQYDNFLSKQNHYDFLQSTQEANKLIKQGKEVEFIQAIENGNVVATATLTYMKIAKVFRYCNILRGAFLDYHNKDLVVTFFKALKAFLYKKHVIYIEMDPRIDLIEHDIDGNIVENGFNNKDIVDNLKLAGFIQCPLTKGYQKIKNCRWVSILDLKDKDCEEVFANFSYQTRQDIRTSQKYCVETRVLKKEELQILMDLIKKTEERHHFKERTLEFCEELYDIFGDEYVKTIYSYLNIEKYGNKLKTEQNKIKKEIDEIKEYLQNNSNSTKKLNRLKANEEYYQSLIKKINSFKELQEIHGSELPLACSIFLKFSDTVVYLISASDYDYRVYRGSYAVHWHMIQEAIQEKYSYYDLYGISGNFNSDEDGFGVFNFKRGFGAVVHEYIGVFILPVNKFIFTLLDKIKNISKSIN